MEKGPSLKEVGVLQGWRCHSETIESEGTRGSTWQEVFKWRSPPARPCRNTSRGQCFQWLWEMWELQRYRALTPDRQPCHVTCSMAICHCVATGSAGGAAGLISQTAVGPSWEAGVGEISKVPMCGTHSVLKQKNWQQGCVPCHLPVACHILQSHRIPEQSLPLENGRHWGEITEA